MVHEACPDCEETLKWSMPSFIYKGKILAGFASFKAHATFGYWNEPGARARTRRAERDGPVRPADLARRSAAARDLVALTHKAMTLIDDGVKPRATSTKKAPFTVPQDLRAAIDAVPAAKATFDGFPPWCQREYVEWVTEAKRDETRAKRLDQTVEWLAEGKRRNWKYENC